MALRVRKVAELDEVNTFLRGGIVGGKDIRPGIYGLHGLTLIFTSPAATVTFATTPAGSQEKLTARQILDQINAVGALSGYARTDGSGKLTIESPTGATAVVLGAAGTANAFFGFNTDGATTGIVFAVPGGNAPALVALSMDAQGSGTYILLTDE